MTRLEEIKRRAEQATPGPWNRGVNEFGSLPCLTVGCQGRELAIAAIPKALPDADPNVEFIAASREDIPYLLELVDRMRECLYDVDAHFDDSGDVVPGFMVGVHDLLDELDTPATPSG